MLNILHMPVVSLSLLVTSFDLTTAMALFIVPSFVTNLWQAISGYRLNMPPEREHWLAPCSTAISAALNSI
ncbi:MAG: hypothetical protein GY820_12085 [Gammaproteobacteria bacterium]|nr:hypothetical protein [Gammaproteobacteria bacterium]